MTSRPGEFSSLHTARRSAAGDAGHPIGVSGALSGAVAGTPDSPIGHKVRFERPFNSAQPSVQHQCGLEFTLLPQSAFPDDRHSPSRSEQMALVAPVPAHVGMELGTPEFFASGRCGGVRTPVMTVPEAAVNEAHGSESAKHEVGGTREVAVVQAVPQTACMESPAEVVRAQRAWRDLRRRIGAKRRLPAARPSASRSVRGMIPVCSCRHGASFRERNTVSVGLICSPCSREGGERVDMAGSGRYQGFGEPVFLRKHGIG